MDSEKKTKYNKMSRFQHSLSLYVAKGLNIFFVTLPFALCWYLYYTNTLYIPFYSKGNLAMTILFAVIYLFMAEAYDGLTVSLNRISEMIYSSMLAVLVSDGVIYIVICILYRGFAPVWPGLLCIGAQAIVIVLWSVFAHKWYYRVFRAQRTAIVYDCRQDLEESIGRHNLSKKFDVQGNFSVQECLANLSILDGYETVFFSGVHSHDRNVILKHCVEQDINTYLVPRVGDLILRSSRQIHMMHLPILRVGRYNPSVLYLLTKRVFDILASLLVLIITSPVFLVTAIAVKSDGGPVFYKQARLTKNGKIFKVLKFRSMRVDAEKDGVARLSTGEKDDRITKVGHVIRKVRIDELPQLINILVGDMTIVGPRPERPEIAADYEKTLPEFRLRLQAKAGLTGYAQVYGKYNTTPYDKLLMDLMYISKPSILEDIRIMITTVKILFMAESTEGVAAGQTTAMAEKDEKGR